MTKIDEPRPAGGDSFKSGPATDDSLAPEAAPRKFHLSLGTIMVWLIYFALVSLAGRELYWTGNQLSIILFAVVVGLGICYLGLSLVRKLKRHGILGWVVFFIGYMLISGSMLNSVSAPTRLGFNWLTLDGLKILSLPILLNLILLTGLIGAIVAIHRRKLANDQDALLEILALTADRRMPLAQSVLAFSTQVSGLYQIWVETLGQLLDRGVALPEAVDSLPGLLSRSSRLLIRIGTEVGNLSRGLHESVDSRQIQLPMIRKILGQLVYLGSLGAAGLIISILMMIYVLPQFENIFRAFGLALPELTVSLIQISHAIIEYGWIAGLVVLTFPVILLASLFNGGGMKIPIVDRWFKRRHSILILRSILLVIEADQPISSGMNGLARWYPTHWVRNKLKLVAADIDHGHDWLDSLQSTGLLKPTDLGVLASAQRAGNLRWAIRELIATAERRWSFRLLGMMQIVFIGVLLIFGAFVLLLAMAYFAPLITLIQRLSQ